MNRFMTARSQADMDLLTNLLEKKEQNKNDEIVIRVCANGGPVCIEVELDVMIFHTKLIDLIRSEFSLLTHKLWLWPNTDWFAMTEMG